MIECRLSMFFLLNTHELGLNLPVRFTTSMYRFQLDSSSNFCRILIKCNLDRVTGVIFQNRIENLAWLLLVRGACCTPLRNDLRRSCQSICQKCFPFCKIWAENRRANVPSPVADHTSDTVCILFITFTQLQQIKCFCHWYIYLFCWIQK